MFYRALITAAVGLALSTGGAIYAGGSPKGTHWMQINIKLLRDGRHAISDVNVLGPCNDGSQLGRTIGTTTSQPREPLLRLRHGRFKLHRGAVNETTGISYVYTLTGHRIRRGFAGTLRYVEHDATSDGHTSTCDSTLLPWEARQTDVFR